MLYLRLHKLRKKQYNMYFFMLIYTHVIIYIMNIPVLKDQKEGEKPQNNGTVDQVITVAKDNWIIIAGITAFGIYWYLYDEKMSANIKKQVKKIVESAKESAKAK